MKNIIKIENLFLFVFSIFLFSQTDFAWWIYPLLFLLPDIGMVGYLINSNVGARTYNTTHFFGLAVLLILLGFYLGNDHVYITGIIILGHSAFDRILGYGLKYNDDFKHTHLGWLK